MVMESELLYQLKLTTTYIHSWLSQLLCLRVYRRFLTSTERRQEDGMGDLIAEVKARFHTEGGQ